MTVRNIVPWRWGERRAPLPREESDPIYDLQRHFNQFFDDFLTPFSPALFGGLAQPRAGFQPRVDVSETDQAIVVSAELPGLEEKDIDVTLSADALTITGEKKSEREEKEENYYRMERSYGSFQRMISLPCEIEENKVEAIFKSGVLSITLPKSAAAQKTLKHIPIKHKEN